MSHCHHHNDSCIKMGRDKSHFNVSLVVRDKVARLSTDHNITQSFLLKTEEPPVRIACDERLSIERILPPSSDFIKIRESHFTVQSLRVLFKELFACGNFD